MITRSHEMRKKIKLWRIHLRFWMWENSPVQCVSCRRIYRRRNTHMEVHFGAGIVRFCAECDRRLNSWDGGR